MRLLPLILIFSLLVLLSPLSPPQFSVPVACGASPRESRTLYVSIKFTGFEKGGWNVIIGIRGFVNYVCRGRVTPNPLFEELRLIDKRVSIISLYYLLSSLCPSYVLDEVMGVGNGYVVVSIEAPASCTVRTGLDWSGYGPLGGPYRVDASSFKRFHVYTWIVLVCDKSLVVKDFDKFNLTIIAPESLDELLPELARSTSCAVEDLSALLGSTPLRPRVIIIVDSGVFELIPSDTGLSVGYVIVVKVPEYVDTSRLEMILVHEVAHSWIINGLVYGDPVFQEGAAQLLAWVAARRCLGSEAAWRLIEESEGEYSSYLLLHLALYNASRIACPTNVYIEALRELYQESLRRPGGMIVGFRAFLDKVGSLAREYRCKPLLEALYGHYLLEPGSPIRIACGLECIIAILALLLIMVFYISLRLKNVG